MLYLLRQGFSSKQTLLDYMIKEGPFQAGVASCRVCNEGEADKQVPR